MSNKTPYELRLDILALAKSYLDNIQQLENEVAKAAFIHTLQKNSASIEDWDHFAPTQYTREELLAVARDMYGFIMTKGT